MKNRLITFISTLVLILAYAIHSHALFNGDVDKANEFMAAGMYPQAISLLDKRINEKPTDAKAHFKLGVCYVHTSNFGWADARFVSSVKLDPEYGFRIGGEYKAAGSEALQKGNINRAGKLFGKAVEYQPNLKGGIAKEVMAVGKASMSDSSLSLAYSLNPANGKEICGLYFTAGNNVSGRTAIDFYRKASMFGNDHREEIGKRLVALAKAGGTGKDLTNEYKEAAKGYISDAAWNEAFPPDYKIYPRGTYAFALKAGESTKSLKGHLIKLPSGVDYNFYSSKNEGKFQVRFQNGAVKDQDSANGNYYNTSPFEIISIEEQTITMSITP